MTKDKYNLFGKRTPANVPCRIGTRPLSILPNIITPPPPKPSAPLPNFESVSVRMPVVPVIIPVPKVVPVITVPKVDCVLPKVAPVKAAPTIIPVPKVDCLPDGPIYHNYNLAPTLTPKLKISAATQKVAALTKPPPEDKRRARIRDFIKSFF